MRPVRTLCIAASLLALSLCGCSAQGFSVLSPAAPTRTPAPAVTSTVPPPSVSQNGFDSFAGNCADAANEDVALMNYANTQNYNFDMQLQIKPTLGCDADTDSSTYKTFIRQVADANLTMNALDTAWIYGYVSTRDLFLQSMFTNLQKHYPSLSTAVITITYNGQTRATLAFTGHGAPTINDLYAQ